MRLSTARGLGVTIRMSGFHIPVSAKRIKVLSLSESARKAGDLAEFEKPINESMKVGLLKSGLKGAAHRTSSCMGWIWRQWLLGVPKEALARCVGPFVERGLELRERSQSYDYLALHDLYLLHCAIFACSNTQLNTVAERIADASGDKGQKPLDNGELYAAAWCGMMRYRILGDERRATHQSELIWEAYRDKGVFAAPKPLVLPWLKRDWKAFARCQQKDFEKLWNRARKDCWTVKSENSTEIVVTTERYQIEHQWCWVALRNGIAGTSSRRGRRDRFILVSSGGAEGCGGFKAEEAGRPVRPIADV
jgi:hypothetical protein